MSNINKIDQISKTYITANFEDNGRKQFFYHYPYSELPIRDITSKTEPHIEIGSENYLRCCIQRNTRGFCNSNERYLFLCTRCENRKLREFFGKRFVIGYIEKKIWQKMNNNQLAIIGKTYLVPFVSELDYKKLGFMGRSYAKKFNKKETRKLLKLIHSHKNITNRYIKEMIEKEKNERKKGEAVPIDNECLKYACEFKSICLRRKFR